MIESSCRVEQERWRECIQDRGLKGTLSPSLTEPDLKHSCYPNSNLVLLLQLDQLLTLLHPKRPRSNSLVIFNFNPDNLTQPPRLGIEYNLDRQAKGIHTVYIDNNNPYVSFVTLLLEKTLSLNVSLSLSSPLLLSSIVTVPVNSHHVTCRSTSYRIHLKFNFLLPSFSNLFPLCRSLPLYTHPSAASTSISCTYSFPPTVSCRTL